jgi:hypothetical protein
VIHLWADHEPGAVGSRAKFGVYSRGYGHYCWSLCCFSQFVQRRSTSISGKSSRAIILSATELKPDFESGFARALGRQTFFIFLHLERVT